LRDGQDKRAGVDLGIAIAELAGEIGFDRNAGQVLEEQLAVHPA